MDSEKREEIFNDFMEKLEAETVDIDPEIVTLIEENFWELLSDEKRNLS